MGIVVIASDASSVGKGVIASLIGRGRTGARASVGVGSENRSGFGALCSGVVDCVALNGEIDYWDEVLETIAGGPATICLDTGSAKEFLSWCCISRVSELFGHIDATLVVPVTRSIPAMEAAVRVLHDARTFAEPFGLRFSRFVVVSNERDGKVSDFVENHGLLSLGASQVRIAKAPTLLGALESAGKRLDALDAYFGVKGVGAEVGALFGWDSLRGAHELARYADWLMDCEENLQIAGLFR